MLETVVLLFLFPASLDVNEVPEECDSFIVGDGGGCVLLYNYARQERITILHLTLNIITRTK